MQDIVCNEKLYGSYIDTQNRVYNKKSDKNLEWLFTKNVKHAVKFKFMFLNETGV